MRKSVSWIAVLLFGVSGVAAQDQQIRMPRGAQRLGPQAPAAPPKRALAGEEKVRYLLKGLSLSSEQRQHAAGLFDMYFGGSQTPEINLDRVTSLVAEIEQARAAGDTERQREIEQELRAMGQKADPSGEFLDNMMQVLDEDQRMMLSRAQERLTRNPSGEFRAVDILWAVHACNPIPDQMKRIDARLAEYRALVNRVRTMREERATRLLDELVTDVRALLTADQAARYDEMIESYRP